METGVGGAHHHSWVALSLSCSPFRRARPHAERKKYIKCYASQRKRLAKRRKFPLPTRFSSRTVWRALGAHTLAIRRRGERARERGRACACARATLALRLCAP